MICASAPAIRPLLTPLGSGNITYSYAATGASGGLARKSHNIALQTFGSSGRPLEPGTRSAITGSAAAGESEENIVMKGEGESRGGEEVVSMDNRMERLEVVGDGRSESSRDLEYGR